VTDVRFDDLDALGALCSDTFGPWGEPIAVTQEMIQQFGDLTQDQQWIHVDVERCRRESAIGTTIAHGFLLVSLLPALVRGTGGAAIAGHRTVINYGIDQLRFVSPVPSGSRIQARRRIAHVRKKGPNGTQLTFETEVRVLDADKPALVCRSLVLFQG
jgi:acyl dehydratase